MVAATEADVGPVIRVSGLVNRFGKQMVHDGLDLTIQPNEIFGIVSGDDFKAHAVLFLEQQHALINPVQAIGF